MATVQVSQAAATTSVVDMEGHRAQVARPQVRSVTEVRAAAVQAEAAGESSLIHLSYFDMSICI